MPRLRQRAVCSTLAVCALANAISVTVAQTTPPAGGVPASQATPAPPGTVINGESALRLHVVTANDAPLALAQVTVSLGKRHTTGRTDSAGVFRTDGLIAGEWNARVRRIGYQETQVNVHLDAGENAYTITVDPAATRLSNLTVTGENKYSARLNDFETRRAQGAPNAVITRADIARRHPVQISQMLRTVPGVRMADENGARVPIAARSSVPRLGESMVACPMRVVVDGILMPRLSNIDTIMPKDVHGIEVYYGAARLPLQLANLRPDNWCGLVAIWTRDR